MYLYQVTNNREREYIQHYIISVEKNSIIFNLFLKLCIFIPIMLLIISKDQFIKVFQGLSGMKDFFIAFGLFLVGIVFFFGFFYLGFILPVRQKRFRNQVKNGEVLIQKVKILETSRATNTNGTIDTFYAKSFMDEAGNLHTDKAVKLYGYIGHGRYENGIMYEDVVKGNEFKGIIPILDM